VEWYDIWKDYLPHTRVGFSIAEIDAKNLERIITTLDMCGRGGLGWGKIYTYIIKLDYLWVPRPVIAKAEMAASKFKRGCSKRSYHNWQKMAVAAVFELADPL